MKLRYKHLIPSLPKYLRNHGERKVGDVLESRVIVYGKEFPYRPNDLSLLEKEVVHLFAAAKDRRYSCQGVIVIEIKD